MATATLPNLRHTHKALLGSALLARFQANPSACSQALQLNSTLHELMLPSLGILGAQAHSTFRTPSSSGISDPGTHLPRILLPHRSQLSGALSQSQCLYTGSSSAMLQGPGSEPPFAARKPLVLTPQQQSAHLISHRTSIAARYVPRAAYQNHHPSACKHPSSSAHITQFTPGNLHCMNHTLRTAVHSICMQICRHSRLQLHSLATQRLPDLIILMSAGAS